MVSCRGHLTTSHIMPRGSGTPTGCEPLQAGKEPGEKGDAGLACGSEVFMVRTVLRAALMAALLSGADCSYDYGADTPTTAIMNGGDWRDEVIYQLMVDRFA